MKKSPFRLTPYGVDFLKKSILQAKKLFPQYQENFIEKNIINFHTDTLFDYIIISLGYERYADTEIFMRSCISHLTPKGNLIIINPPDTYKNLEKRIPLLEKLLSKSLVPKNTH
jgi:2-polyprenyl-3-methyl-5-hydroxy-6-metoxy-1,4-benzoquinol methylase